MSKEIIVTGRRDYWGMLIPKMCVQFKIRTFPISGTLKTCDNSQTKSSTDEVLE